MAERTVEIKYQVDTAAEGEAQVAALAREIDNLGGNASETKTKADALSQSLRSQENAKAAVDAFQSLNKEVDQLEAKLGRAEVANSKAAAKQKEFADEVLASGPPTKDQADKLATLTAKQDAAQKSVDQLRTALNLKRTALTEVGTGLQKTGIDTTKLGAAEADLSAKIAVTKRALNEQIGALVDTKNQLTGAGQEASRFGATFANLGRQLLGLAGISVSLAGIKSAITSVVSESSRLEGIKDRLGDVFGGAAQGNAVLDRLRQLSKEVPQNLDQLADASVRLKRVGLDPLDGSLQALIDSNSALGRSDADLIPLIDKVADAYAKGKLEQRDIVALQKEGVPVIDLLTAATGKNAEEIERLANAGLLGRDAIKALLDELERKSAGAAAGDMDQFATIVEKAKDRFKDFLAQVGDSGPLQFFKDQLKAGTDEIDRSASSAAALGQTITVVSAGVVFALNTIKASWNIVTAASSTFAAGVVEAFAVVADQIGKLPIPVVAQKFRDAATEMKLVAEDLRESAKADLDDIADAGRGTGQAITGAGAAITTSAQQAAVSQETLKQKVTETGDAATAAGAKQKAAAADALRAAADQVVSLSAALTEADKLGQRFVALQAEGKTAADAVGILFQTAAQSSPQGLLALEVALDDIGRASKDSAQALREGVAAELKKLTDQELVAFQQRTQEALNSVKGFSTDGSTLLREVLREELRRIGIDLQEVRTGVDETSRKFTDAFTAISTNAAATGQEIKLAFTNALSAADTRQELDLLKQQLDGVKVAGFDTAAAIQQIEDRIRSLAGAGKDLAAVNQAFADLGITSRQAFEDAKQRAIDAFAVIRRDGTLAAGDVDRAFAAMADKVLAAAAAAGEYELKNAEAMLKAQTSTGNQSKALDELIAKYDQSGKAASDYGDKAKKAHDDAADAAKKEKAEQDRIDKEFSKRGVLVGSSVPDLLSDDQKKQVADLLAQLQKVQAAYAGNATSIATATNQIIKQIRDIDAAAVQAASGVGRMSTAIQQSTQAAAQNPQLNTGNTVNPFKKPPATPAPTGTPQPAPSSPSPSSPSSGSSSLVINLDGETVFQILVTDENVKRYLIPILQRYLALTR